MSEQGQVDRTEVVELPGGALKALAACAGEQGRYRFDAVLAIPLEEERLGCTDLCAADGSVLACMTLDNLGDEGLFSLGKPGLWKNKAALFGRNNGQLEATQSQGNQTKHEVYKQVKGQWPDYRNVIPPMDTKPDISLNVSNLRRVLDLVEAAGHSSVKLWLGNDARCPVGFQGAAESYWRERGRYDPLPVRGAIAPNMPDEQGG